MLRSLSKNQILILEAASKGFISVNSLAEFLLAVHGLPKSTTKLNLEVLIKLGLVIKHSNGFSKEVRLTKAGLKILKLLR